MPTITVDLKNLEVILKPAYGENTDPQGQESLRILLGNTGGGNATSIRSGSNVRRPGNPFDKLVDGVIGELSKRGKLESTCQVLGVALPENPDKSSDIVKEAIGDFLVLKHTPTSNIPSVANPFVGREAELNQLLLNWDMLEPLVEVAGIGGQGKTALAHQFAHALCKNDRKPCENNKRSIQGATLCYRHVFEPGDSTDSIRDFLQQVCTHFCIATHDEVNRFSNEQLNSHVLELLLHGYRKTRPVLIVLERFAVLLRLSLDPKKSLPSAFEHLIREFTTACKSDGKANDKQGMILLSSSIPCPDESIPDTCRLCRVSIGGLPLNSFLDIFKHHGYQPGEDVSQFWQAVGGHPGAAAAVCRELRASGPGRVVRATELFATLLGPSSERRPDSSKSLAARILHEQILTPMGRQFDEEERYFIKFLSYCINAAVEDDVENVFLPFYREFCDAESKLTTEHFHPIICRLGQTTLLRRGSEESGLDLESLLATLILRATISSWSLEKNERACLGTHFERALSNRTIKYGALEDATSQKRLFRANVELAAHRARAGYHHDAITLIRNRIRRNIGYMPNKLIDLQHITFTYLDLLGYFFPNGDFARAPKDSIERWDDRAWVVNEVATTYHVLGQPLKAIDMYQRCPSLWREEGKHDRLAVALINRSACWIQLGWLIKALGDALEAWKHIEAYLANGVDPAQSRHHLAARGTIASIYELMGRSKEAAVWHPTSSPDVDGGLLLSVRAPRHAMALARKKRFSEADAELNRIKHKFQDRPLECRQELVDYIWAAEVYVARTHCLSSPLRGRVRSIERIAELVGERPRVSPRSHYCFTFAMQECARAHVILSTRDGGVKARARRRMARRLLEKTIERSTLNRVHGYHLIVAEATLGLAEIAHLEKDFETAAKLRNDISKYAKDPVGYDWAPKDADNDMRFKRLDSLSD